MLTAPAVRAAILKQLLADHASGSLRPCSHYQERYPGYETLVAEEYREVEGSPVEPSAESRSSGPSFASPFLAAFERDRAGGHPRTLAEYLAEYPEAADLIIPLVAAQALEQQAARGAPVGAGTILGSYRLRELIGRGGQGEVYRATDLRLQRDVAVKVLAARDRQSAATLERFRREALLAARANHPNICGVLEADTQSDPPFVVMPFIEGESLAAAIRRTRDEQRGPFTAAELRARVAFFEKAVRAVHAAHELGVVHRDLKPSNLMVNRAGEPVLLDFGLARGDGLPAGSLTASDDLLGTPEYMSPEQVDGRADDIDLRTDIYSLGVTLFEWLTLQLPYAAPTRVALFRAIVSAPPRAARSLQPALSRDLNAVLHAALEKARARRYGTAAAFADDLRAVVESRPVSVRAPTLLSRLVRWMEREPVRAMLAAALLVALVAAGGLGGFLLAKRGRIALGEQELKLREEERFVMATFGWMGSRQDAQQEHSIRSFLEQHPDSILTRLLWIDLLLRHRQPTEALALTGITPSSDDEALALRRARGAALRALGRPAEADREESTPASRSEGLPYEQFAAGLLDTLRFEAGERALGRTALDHFDRAIFLRSRPSFALQICRARLLLFLSVGDHALVDAALDSARVLEEQWPESAVALCFAAQACHQRDPERTARLSRRASELDPALPEAYAQWGAAELALERIDAALEACALGMERASRTHEQGFANLALIHALALERANRPDDALRQFKASLQADPGNDLAARRYARFLRERRPATELIAELERRVDAVPGDGFAWFSLAEQYRAAGQREQAHAAAVEADAHRASPFMLDDGNWTASLDRLLRELEDPALRQDPGGR